MKVTAVDVMSITTKSKLTVSTRLLFVQASEEKLTKKMHSLKNTTEKQKPQG